MHSERDEEEFLLSFWTPDFLGFFVDIGANDGIRLSNTRALFERGWSGLCVEADPHTFAHLQRTYADTPRVALEQSAVWNFDGTTDMFAHRGEECSGLSSLLPYYRPHDWPVELVQVNVITLDSLLEKHGVNVVTFLAIDAEGCDYAILEAYSFRIKPQLVMVEHDHAAVGLFDVLFGQLGYEKVFHNIANAAYQLR